MSGNRKFFSRRAYRLLVRCYQLSPWGKPNERLQNVVLLQHRHGASSGVHRQQDRPAVPRPPPPAAPRLRALRRRLHQDP